MINRIKEFIFGKKVNISEDSALQIAKKTCTEKNYQWIEPVRLSLARGVYSVWTNTAAKGNNFWIKIDASDGSIINLGNTPY